MRILSLIVLLLVGLSLLVWPLSLQSQEGASLSIYPQTGTFTAGSTFEVSIFLNTGGNNVNVVKVDLKFDPERLQVITPAKGLSIVAEWIFPPSFSNSKGTITLQGGFPARGINTSEGLITVIVFKAISPGKTEVRFLESSRVLVGEEEGINVLTSFNRGVYEIILPLPKGPRIFSETHPDQNKWYKNDSPVFSWEKTWGAAGYSYRLDDDPYGEPDSTIDTESTSASFEMVEQGIRYFHLKAKRDQVWGGTSHFQIRIDKTPPLEFKPYLEPFSLTSGNYVVIYFNTSDLLSGMDHYEVRIADFTDPEHVVLSGWTLGESPFRLTTEKSGTFRVLVRAFDKAGNFQEGKIQVRIFSPPFVMVTGGVQIRGVFVPWWLIYGLIGVILAGIGYLIFGWIKRETETPRARLYREIKEAEKEIEDVRKAEEEMRKMRELEEKGRERQRELREALRREIELPERETELPERETETEPEETESEENV